MVKWDPDVWGGDTGAWYCRGRIRPLLRGWSHAAACVLSPIYALERLSEAKTNSLAAAVVLELLAQLWLFGASAAYHRGRWSLWGEALAARLDYVGIFAYIGFCYAPMSVALFGFAGWLIVTASGALVAAGAYLTFSETLKADRGVMVGLYTMQGAFGVVPVMCAYLAGMLTNEEVYFILLGIASFFVGSQLYVYTWPMLAENHFTYHDLFHMFVVLGAFALHCCNWHVLRRTEAA